MARVNTDILGIRELKWTGMGEFNSDNHYIYYYGQEPLRRNRVAFIVNKRVQNTIVGCNLKSNRMVLVESSDKMWSTGEGNGKPLQYSFLENPMNRMKRQKDER